MKAKSYRKTGMLPMKQFDRKQIAQWMLQKRKEFGKPRIATFTDARVYWWPESSDSVYQFVVMAH